MKKRVRSRKDAVLIARCESSVKAQIEEMASHFGLDVSDIIRLALREGLSRVQMFQLAR